ncbi:YdcH family protein [Octadecabacter sp. CECT 8868]|uniref:YdcH family protein n=1 Tax=Octadecabacter algicola TaxID=2909342 RepID=UPI001F477EB0|nr:YdcH family protein [Octadecabacter algicola]MCF2904704.1 YdcH family protein [Octadecabacter algicola]
MSLSSHLEELKRKHETLSDAVEKAQRSPGSDDLEVSRLKKEKLYLKEEITRLTPA